MYTITCPKCGKKMNPQKSFDIYLGSNGLYYDYKMVSFAKKTGERNILGVLNAPNDITLKFVSVGYDCISTIRAEILARDNGNEEITRKFYSNRK